MKRTPDANRCVAAGVSYGQRDETDPGAVDVDAGPVQRRGRLRGVRRPHPFGRRRPRRHLPITPIRSAGQRRPAPAGRQHGSAAGRVRRTAQRHGWRGDRQDALPAAGEAVRVRHCQGHQAAGHAVPGVGVLVPCDRRRSNKEGI